MIECVICGSTDGAADGICNYHYMVYQDEPEKLEEIRKQHNSTSNEQKERKVE